MTAWQDMSLWERFKDEHGRLKEIRQPFDVSREVIAEQFRPDIVGTKKDKGQFTGAGIIEGTGPWALGVMTRGLLGSLAGPSFEWIRYAVPERSFKGIDDINHWLQNTQEHQSMVYRESTFYDIMPGYVSEGLSIGSPVTIIEEDVVSGRSVFHRPNYSKCWFSRDMFGDVNVLHVEHEYTAKTAMKRFGKENLSQAVQDQLEKGLHDKKSTYLQVFYSPNDPIFDKEGKPYEIDVDPDAQCVMFYIQVEVSEIEKQKPLQVKPYYSKPYVVWDYHRNDSEICARTPAWNAMPDTKGHNAIWKTIHKSGQRNADPAMWAMATMRGRLRLGPGSVTWVDSTQDFDRQPQALHNPSSFTQTEYIANTSAQSLRRHFHVNVWLKIEEYQRLHRQPPTAAEIYAMEGENAPQIGPAVQSVERGLLGPIDKRLLSIEGEAGRLPTPPDVWLEYTQDGRILPQFVGPLAVAQGLALKLRRLETGLQMAAPFFELDPMTVHKVKSDKGVEHALEAADFPQDLIRDDEEYQEIAEGIRQMEAQREEIEQGEMIAGGVNKLQGPTDETSPLAMAGAA